MGLPRAVSSGKSAHELVSKLSINVSIHPAELSSIGWDMSQSVLCSSFLDSSLRVTTFLHLKLRHQLEAFNTTAAASNGGIRIAVGFSNVRDDEILRFLKILLYGNSVKVMSFTDAFEVLALLNGITVQCYALYSSSVGYRCRPTELRGSRFSSYHSPTTIFTSCQS